jgi:hypothetical protein
MKWNETLPVIIPIMIIITIAVLQKQSRLIAAIIATMPVNIPLALYVVYSVNNGDRLLMSKFASGLLIGMIPTVAFVITIWVVAHAGLKLIPMISIGYVVWGIILLLMLGMRKFLGI